MEKIILVIGNKNYSSWSLRPWLVLKQAGIPFKEILIPLFEPGYKEKILKYSPSGKVPLLKHGKVVVWESLAIAEYVHELFPKKNLWPKEKGERAWARAVSHEMHAGFMALRKNCPMNVRERINKELPSEVSQDLERITTIWQECRSKFNKRGPFLFGGFSIADAMYAPVVFRIQTYNLKVSGEAKKYCDTMLSLQSLKDWTTSAVKEPYTIDRH